MSAKIERAVKALFLDQSAAAENVKFFLGTKRGVTADELAGQLLRADAQIRNGLAAPTATLDGELTSQTI